MLATSKPHVRLLTGDTFDRCPKAWLTQDALDVAYLFTAFRVLERYQILPQGGGYDDQSPHFIEALEIMRSGSLVMGRLRSELETAKAAAKRTLATRRGLKVVA